MAAIKKKKSAQPKSLARSESMKGNKNAVGNNGGRPLKYTDEWLENEAKAFREWAIGPRNLWLKGFAYERGYHPQDLAEFAKKSGVFAEALAFAKEEQERKFIYGAWSKEMGMDFVKYFMPRMLRDRPEWKLSWDKEEDKPSVAPTIIINKIEK